MSALDRVSALVDAADADRAVAEIWEALGLGCQEREMGDRLALDVWVPGGGARAARDVGEILSRAGIAAEVETEPEPDDWEDGLRRHHQPVVIAGRLSLRPPWAAARPDLLDIVIDPGMAFGTGQHATTRGCLELMCRISPEGPLLDLGCGSGVLAIAGRRLGFDPIRAIDLDPLATDATLRNARANGVGLAVARMDVLRACYPLAQTVTANLMSELLLDLAERLCSARTPRTLILSGLQEHEAPEVVAEYERRGFGQRDEVAADGWVSALLER